VRGAVSAAADAQDVEVPDASLKEAGRGLSGTLGATRREQALDGECPVEGFEKLVGIVGGGGPPTHVGQGRLEAADRKGGRVWE
jgi:hypothetical protein